MGSQAVPVQPARQVVLTRLRRLLALLDDGFSRLTLRPRHPKRCPECGAPVYESPLIRGERRCSANPAWHGVPGPCRACADGNCDGCTHSRRRQCSCFQGACKAAEDAEGGICEATGGPVPR